jgi:cysteinyl-tRNA synthetase
MKLYNTLTKRKEEFRPETEGLVKIYVCGPTVYDHSHIGHGRTYVVYDILERYLRYLGYDVKKAINITDIDDKMINRAKELGIPVNKLADIMTLSYLEDIINLNILIPEFMPKATHHIDDMINLINKLLEKGYAYVTKNGDVYFDATKYKKYGELSKQSIEDLIKGYRIEPGEEKRNPIDFALWKGKKPGEPHWNTPWGEGRPGWHIECSAMSMKLLGETIDIHGGGQDLIFPHHENEKAQSEAATGKPFVKYWMHTGLLTVGGEEMSKSKGNMILLKDILKEYDSDSLRLLYLSTHYRSPLDFKWDRLKEAEKISRRIRITYQKLTNINMEVSEIYEEENIRIVREYRKKIIDALDDDLNTPLALSEFLGFIRWINSYLTKEKPSKITIEEAIKLIEDIKYIFGLKLMKKPIEKDRTSRLIEVLIEIRNQLRKEKKYDLADMIRDRLKELNIVIEDTPEGTKYYME